MKKMIKLRSNLLVFIFVLLVGLLSGCVGYEQVHRTVLNTTDIYYIGAPFGTVYPNTRGSGGIFSWSLNTAPKEAYRIKYYEGTELKTRVFDSTASNFHLMVGRSVRFECVSLIREHSSTYERDMNCIRGNYGCQVCTLSVPNLPQIDNYGIEK